jgi:hypothetical protein
MSEGETAVVEVASTETNASRPKRVKHPTTRFEQGTNQPTINPSASPNTDIGTTMKLILKAIEQQGRKYEEMLQEQSQKYEELLREQEKKHQEQNRKFQEQLSSIKDQLDSLSNANRSLTNSYADAVKRGLAQSPPATASQGTPNTGICSMNPSSSASQQDLAASLNIVLDLTQCENTNHRTAKAGAVRKNIDDALADSELTKDIKCRGISRNPNDPNRFKVSFRTEQDARTVRQNQEWTFNQFPGATIQAEKWYAVKADSVPKQSVFEGEEVTKVPEQKLQDLGQENQVTIRKVRWLSKPEKKYGSMVIYLASREDATKLLRDGSFDVEGEMSYIRPFEQRPGPIRCRKCHQFNHIAHRCPSSQMICAKCAQPGHEAQSCTCNEVKCAVCHGPHATYDNKCRAYQLEKEKYLPRHE